MIKNTQLVHIIQYFYVFFGSKMQKIMIDFFLLLFFKLHNVEIQNAQYFGSGMQGKTLEIPLRGRWCAWVSLKHCLQEIFIQNQLLNKCYSFQGIERSDFQVTLNSRKSNIWGQGLSSSIFCENIFEKVSFDQTTCL